MIKSRIAILADPMIAVLIIATSLALLLPAVGEARGVAQTISNAGIFALFLINGMRIARGEIARGLVNWRFFLPLGLFVFFGMGAGGYGVAVIAQSFLEPTIALGFIFLGVLPSTVQSATSYTSLAEGNAALSVVGAALINIVGVFISAPLFALLAGGDAVDLGYETVIRIGVILILPFVIGQAVQGYTREWVLARKSKVAWVDRFVIGTAVYVAFSGAVEMGLLGSISAGALAGMIGITAAFMLVAYAAAWWLARSFGYAFKDCIAFLFAAPQKSVAIGAPLAALLFASEIAGFVIAPLLIYHLLQLVVAAPLASWLAQHPQN
jgi:sodium/bile acid cotransporter 7